MLTLPERSEDIRQQSGSQPASAASNLQAGLVVPHFVAVETGAVA